jgi:uncharacterized membrane protein YjjP (DUF1212 family)
MTSDELLKTVLRIGHYMLEFGGEIYRVEESITRMCKAYGAKSVDVFAIPSSLVVTISMADDKPVTMTKRVRAFQTDDDLTKVDRLSNLSRYICDNTPDSQTVSEMVEEILKIRHYNAFVMTLCFSIVPAAFCLFFGGNLKDAAVAFFIGGGMKYLLDLLRYLKTNIIFTNIIASLFSSVTAIFAVNIGLGENYDKIIIGSIMLLVPGLILTNSMRDFIMGDFMAGILRLIAAILIATGIAIGVALALTAFGFSG